MIKFLLVLCGTGAPLLLYFGLVEVGMADWPAQLFGSVALFFLLFLRVLSYVHAEEVAKLLKKEE